MAVSNNTDYYSTTTDIIKDAYATLNIYSAGEEISANDFEYAKRLLNRMVKAWMAIGYHLWVKETAFLFTQKNQVAYTLSSTSTDNATLSYHETTLAVDGVSGNGFVVVTDDSNINNGDYIGIMIDDNTMFWATVSSKVSNTVNFDLGAVLPGNANSGTIVYSYTEKLDTPFNIYSGVRSEDSIIDVPLNYLSYEDYFELPNKYTSKAIPISYNYDRQRDESIIRLWPNPYKGGILIKLTIARKIYNFDTNSNDPDFPVEWQETIIDNLAIRLAPSFGKNKDDGFQMLKIKALESLELAKSFDNELGSIYLVPSNRHA